MMNTEETTMIETKYTVQGMTCGNRVSTVTEEIQKVSGVTGVTVDLAAKAVTVAGDGFDDGAVRSAINQAGYETSSSAPSDTGERPPATACSCCN